MRKFFSGVPEHIFNLCNLKCMNMTSGATISIKIVLLLSIGLKICQAGNHYCVNGLTSSVELDEFYHRDETIVPSIPNEPEEQQKKYKRCKWNIHFKTPDISNNLQIILQTMPDSREGSDGGETARKDLNIFSQGDPTATPMRATPGLFLVYPLLKRNRFTNTIEWDPKTQSRTPIRLRYLVPIPGICNIDMLSFKGRCYSISKFRQNATEAIFSIEGDAQLASFTNVTEIRQLIKANEERKSTHPYRNPLNLHQKVRLGMIYRAADDAMFSFVRNESGACELRPSPKLQDEKVPKERKVSCASLSLNEVGNAIVTFDDCSSPMLSMVSFREMARFDQNLTGCSMETVNQLLLQVDDVATKKSKNASSKRSDRPKKNPEGNHTTSTTPDFVVVIIVPVVLIVLIVLFVSAIILRNKKNVVTEQ